MQKLPPSLTHLSPMQNFTYVREKRLARHGLGSACSYRLRASFRRVRCVESFLRVQSNGRYSSPWAPANKNHIPCLEFGDTYARKWTLSSVGHNACDVPPSNCHAPTHHGRSMSHSPCQNGSYITKWSRQHKWNVKYNFLVYSIRSIFWLNWLKHAIPHGNIPTRSAIQIPANTVLYKIQQSMSKAREITKKGPPV
jgi:hypothetical protein